MKKSLIALAVAGVVATPAFAASSNVDIYGKFRMSVDDYSNDIGVKFSDDVSRIGIKGSEDLGGGLKAIYQYETAFSIGATNANVGGSAGGLISTPGGGLGGQRDTFLGLSGGFGTVLAGRHDTPYKMAGSADLFADTALDAQNLIADPESVGPTGYLGRCIICEDLRVDNAIAYVSPSFSGVTLVGAIVTGNAGLPGVSGTANGLADAYSLAALYGNGPLTLSAGYEVLTKKLLGSRTDPNITKDNTAWKLNGAYTIGDLKLGATYESVSDVFGLQDVKSKDYLLSASYAMGPISLMGQYGKRDVSTPASLGANHDSAGDLTDWSVGAAYNLSKRTNAYVAYGNYKPGQGGDAGANDVTCESNCSSKTLGIFTVGMNHDF